MKDKAQGFTLIEVLVVIGIISLLASIMMVTMVEAREKSRDAKRLQDLKQLATALDLYYDDHGAYPECTAAIGGDQWCGACDPQYAGSEFEQALQPLVTEKYLTKIPKDPLNRALCYTYEYFTSNQPDQYGSYCSGRAIGNYYYIIRFATENTKDFSLPEWVRQRVSGKEYCLTGFK